MSFRLPSKEAEHSESPALPSDIRYHAANFLRSADLLLGEDVDGVVPVSQSGLMVPGIVMAAFAAELGLKALHLQFNPTKNLRVFGHSLYALFGGLSEETKNSIFSRCVRSSQEVEASLIQGSDAFAKWRYSYEHALLVVDRTTVVDVARASIEVFDALAAN